MDDRLARLDAAVGVLTDRVKALELRVVELEWERGGAPARDRSPVASATGPAYEGVPVQQWLALVGRTLVVLGGAYLLRALTDTHVVTAHVGVALGLVYGAPWLFFASRAGARGVQLDAFCHALATALIGYPLVWEATLKFGVLAPAQSAALLGALTAAALGLAAVTRLHGLAWVVTLGAFGSAAGLALATREWTSYTLLSIGLGFGTLWLGYFRNWGDMRWLAAAGANLMLLFATDQAALRGAPAAALLLQSLAFAGYIGSFGVRHLAGSHRVTAFEAIQSTAVIAVALGGSIYLLRSTGSVLPVGLAALALGLSAYGLAFGFVRQRRDATTFFFWALFALVLSAIGTAVCAGAGIASLVYAASAATLAVIARRHGSLTLGLHASIYAMAAAVGSGLIGAAGAALTLQPVAGWRSLDAAALLALVALAVAVLATRPVLSDVEGPVVKLVLDEGLEGFATAARIPRLILVCALVWTSMGVAVLLATSIAGDPARLDTSLLATLRTAVLVAATLVLARVARYESGREAGWLMYPVLVITGLKLVFVDLPLGRPQTLFAALALYGFALIVAPRLLRFVSPIRPAVTRQFG